MIYEELFGVQQRKRKEVYKSNLFFSFVFLVFPSVRAVLATGKHVFEVGIFEMSQYDLSVTLYVGGA